jgi:hypothetical protein
MLIARVENSDSSAKYIKWHLHNPIFQYMIPTSWATAIARCQDRGIWPQKHIRQQTCFNADCCRRSGISSGKHDHRQVYRIFSPPIQYWDLSHHLDYRWYGVHSNSAGLWDLWYHIKLANVVQEGIMHPINQFWSLVEGNSWSGVLKNHSTPCTTFQISKDASSEPYITVKMAKRVWWQLHQQYF